MSLLVGFVVKMDNRLLNVLFTDTELKERIEAFLAEKRKSRSAGLSKEEFMKVD